jgi:hypothetical protein
MGGSQGSSGWSSQGSQGIGGSSSQGYRSGWGDESGSSRRFGREGRESMYGSESGRGESGRWSGRQGSEMSGRFGSEMSGGRYGTETSDMQTYRGVGPKGYKRSDERIQEDVNDRLTDAPDIDASSVECRVQNGEVTLTGTVPDRETKRNIEELAESISGVKEVQNNLRVKKQQDRGSSSSKDQSKEQSSSSSKESSSSSPYSSTSGSSTSGSSSSSTGTSTKNR